MVESGGLLGGLGTCHLRMLCENPWEGGGGYTPEQVGRMTLDQVWFRLCDRGMLKGGIGDRTEKTSSLEAASLVDEDGMIKGRAADGTPIRGKIRGRSKARELMEKARKVERKKRRRGGK